MDLVKNYCGLLMTEYPELSRSTIQVPVKDITPELCPHIISALFMEGLSMLFRRTIEGLATALFPSLIRV